MSDNTNCTDHILGETLVRYQLDPQTGRINLLLLPKGRVGDLAKHRARLETPDLLRANREIPGWSLDPLVNLHLREDPPPTGQGMSFLQSRSSSALRFESQEVIRGEGSVCIRTTLRAERGYRCIHYLEWNAGDDGFILHNEFCNDSTCPLTLEMISSFSLANLSPFQADDGPGKYRLHRCRSAWSLEAKPTVENLEALHLERSWAGYLPDTERFGVTGSWPVRRFFPFVALEDIEQQILWGAQVAWCGSWQMEIGRSADCLTLAGGLADREFGHWFKTIQPGEVFTTPPALAAVVEGDIQDLTHVLTGLQSRLGPPPPAAEADLPIVFNDWCTTWGKPTHERMQKIGQRLQGTGVKYLVMDAGWFKQGPQGKQSGYGDWQVKTESFPLGLKATTDALRQMGFIPGIWIEMEVTTVGAKSFGPEYDDWHLKRDGHVIKLNGVRSFWDFRQARVIDYLSEKVIAFLREHGFGYLKIDYNGTIGMGCDGAESLGEGLRQHLEGVKAFIARIQRELPELVIENCASGGHRLSPDMIGQTALSSFSDAHECQEIPYIAANLQGMIEPARSLIWAVLQRDDTAQRLYYSLAATFLGRMCLSGEIDEMPEESWRICREAQSLYQRAWRVIKQGKSRLYDERGPSMHNPKGRQLVARQSTDGSQFLVVFHTFKESPINTLTIPLPPGEWRVAGSLNAGNLAIRPGALEVRAMADFQGGVVLMNQSQGESWNHP